MKKIAIVLSMLLSFGCYANYFNDVEDLMWSGNVKDVITILDENPELINATDGGMSFTLLHLASMVGNAEVAHYLIKNGADVDAKDAEGFTPLIRAKANKNLDIVEVLVSNGAK